MRQACLLLLLALALGAAPTRAQEGAQTIVHLLDYIGVDYAGAVENGKVRDDGEYQEMREFTTQVTQRIKALPDAPGKAALLSSSEALAKQVRGMANAAAVAEAAGKLRWSLISTYKLQVAPRFIPDLARANALYAQQCAACHGAQGRGDGPAGKGLDPAPSDFHDAERMLSRSAYGLYNTISLGVGGTAMTPYTQLSEEERWALAFFVANLRLPAERLKEGERLWKNGEARAAFPDIANVATRSGQEIAREYGDRAVIVQDYLRAHPEALAAVRPAPIAFSRARLAEARAAHAAGNHAGAKQAAITAYLEGFELVEASLDNVDKSLRLEIEREMMALRSAIDSETPAAFSARIDRTDALLAAAEARLGAGELSPSTAFVSSLLILLREGLEAILVLAAVIAFVVKSGRREALRYVHAGWMAALAAGAMTWVAATFLIDISGADRELTEGITALLAAAMLLYVGWWLHGKSHAQAWQTFVKEQVGRALEQRTLWAMASVSFLAVYREMFEIVLFYQTLWLQAGDASHGAVLYGAGLAALLLGAIGWAIFKYSIRLPLGPFFAATAMLLVALAVIFTGHGVAALQEAGVFDAHTLNFSPVPLLGLYPSVEALAAQGFALLLVGAGYWIARRPGTC